MAYEHGSDTKRLPAWLRRPLATPGQATAVEGLLGELRLNTVCRSAKCPNRGECYSAGTTTFLVGGDACMRGCRFCAVETGAPEPLDPSEPTRVAEAAAKMGLRHVVITMVTRDDLEDGAAGHIVATIEAVRDALPEAAIEVLTSDFKGRLENVTAVVAARPDVFNHNLETVPRLYADVRPGAIYARSLRVLEFALEVGCAAVADGSRGAIGPIPTKSGLMLGLGETRDEVVDVMRDLRAVGVTMLTLGQYLRPSAKHLPVAEFVDPTAFAAYAREARALGFEAVASAPFVRSSYHAGELAGKIAV